MSNAGMRRNAWDPKREALREALKDARERAGLTQTQLADKLGSHQGFVSKYESGARNLDFVEVLLVCKACNYPIDKLIKAIRLS